MQYLYLYKKMTKKDFNIISPEKKNIKSIFAFKFSVISGFQRTID